MSKNYNPKEYPAGRSPFFLVSCGCLGLHIGGDSYVLVRRCDAGYNEPEMGVGSEVVFSTEKTYHPLTHDQTKALLDNLGFMVARGYRLNEVQSLLGMTVPPQPYRIELRRSTANYENPTLWMEKNT